MYFRRFLREAIWPGDYLSERSVGANRKLGSMPGVRRLLGGVLYSSDGRLDHDVGSKRAAFVYIGKLEFRVLCAARYVDGQASAKIAFDVGGLVATALGAPGVYAQHGEIA